MLLEKNFGRLVVKVYENRQTMGEEAAKEASSYIIEQLKIKEFLNIVFAAAPSQNEFLAALAASEGIDWTRINAFHMDEYIGLPDDAPQGFGNFLKSAIFSKVPFRSVNYLNKSNLSPSEICEKYTQLLLKYPVDIVMMGIGENGHIAFNDPHVAMFNDLKMVKVVELDKTCRNQQVNDGCFASMDLVPMHAITLTVPTLMSANRLFCIVPGKLKANAVKNTLTGSISEKCPATILRTHPSATLYCDKDSAAFIG
ncbi:MAG: glucosamine-6-phosphate deaminase [Bacteroidales bacterium]|nr:glucosamine-6-phosphate deaminase [Bacteroidales bacterium]